MAVKEKVKDFLGYENTRNKKHADMYVRMLRHAYGQDVAVLIGHHLTFEFDGDITTENEIPAADTLIFDHEIMGRIFGRAALGIMAALAQRPAETRDELLASYLESVGV